MTQNGNPLIGTTNGDTIAGIHDYMTWLLQVTDSDDQTPKGMICSLRLVLGAVGSLKVSTEEKKT